MLFTSYKHTRVWVTPHLLRSIWITFSSLKDQALHRAGWGWGEGWQWVMPLMKMNIQLLQKGSWRAPWPALAFPAKLAAHRGRGELVYNNTPAKVRGVGRRGPRDGRQTGEVKAPRMQRNNKKNAKSLVMMSFRTRSRIWQQIKKYFTRSVDNTLGRSSRGTG